MANSEKQFDEEKPLVEMKNIHKWFGQIHALKGIDFHVKRREIVGLVGDNGAGKSTLIKILSGFHEKDKGETFVKGEEVEISSTRHAKKLEIETVYQDQALAPELGISRNIFMGREETNALGFMDKDYMDQASMSALQRLGLNLRSPDQSVETLSGGERQGVAIARTLMFEAKLVILDEPTIALSVKEVRQVTEFINKLKDKGISVIFITHNLYHVFPVADRFVVLGRGKKIGDVAKSETSIEELNELLSQRAKDGGEG